MLEQDIKDSAVDNKEVKDNVESNKYSIEYCLEQIEQIASNTEYITQAMQELSQTRNDDDGKARASALSDIVKCRETTNQKLLHFYEKMYDDLKAPVVYDVITQKAHLQEQLLKVMESTINTNDYDAEDVTNMFNRAFDSISHIND